MAIFQIDNAGGGVRMWVEADHFTLHNAGNATFHKGGEMVAAVVFTPGLLIRKKDDIPDTQ